MHVVLKKAKHDDDLILIEGVTNALTLLFIRLIGLAKSECRPKHVFEQCLERASLVNLGVLSHHNIFDAIRVSDEQSDVSPKVDNLILVLAVVKGALFLGLARLIEQEDEKMRNSLGAISVSETLP